VPTNIIFYWRQIGHTAQEPMISAVRLILEAIFIYYNLATGRYKQNININVKYTLFVHVVTSRRDFRTYDSSKWCFSISICMTYFGALQVQYTYIHTYKVIHTFTTWMIGLLHPLFTISSYEHWSCLTHCNAAFTVWDRYTLSLATFNVERNDIGKDFNTHLSRV